MTKTGDIEKTFSGLKNLAVLQGFGTKNSNELGWYRQTFLTTVGGFQLRLHPAGVERLLAPLHQRLVVDHDGSHWCVPPSRSTKTLALWFQQPQLRALSGAALLLACSSPPSSSSGRDRPRSRRVGHGERVGGEELRRKDRARARHVAADHAARRHSAARGCEGAAQALAVQRARGAAPMVSVARALRWLQSSAVAAPEAVSVPVDTSPTVVKFPALAVLLMVSVLPVILWRSSEAHAGRP